MGPVSRAENILDRLFSKRLIISCDRDPYLHRWFVIRSERFALFIHKFVRSDEDRALHDHPWNFLVIPIWRGYFEHSEAGRHRVWPILGARFRLGTFRHRVELLKYRPSVAAALMMNASELRAAINRDLPSWSIFIRFRKYRDWGFWMPEGWVQWNRWWQEKCE